MAALFRMASGRSGTIGRRDRRLSLIGEDMNRPPIHPGEILGDELEEIGITATELARQLAVPQNRISQIIQGKRSITGDTALRLGHWFQNSAAFWLKPAVGLRLALGRGGVRARDRCASDHESRGQGRAAAGSREPSVDPASGPQAHRTVRADVVGQVQAQQTSRLGLHRRLGLADRAGGGRPVSLSMATASSRSAPTTRALSSLSAGHAGEAGALQHRRRVRAASARPNGPGSPSLKSGIGSTGVSHSSGLCIHSTSARPRQATKAQRPPGASALRRLAKAPAGSSKNMMPNRDATRSAEGAKPWREASASIQSIGRAVARAQSRIARGGVGQHRARHVDRRDVAIAAERGGQAQREVAAAAADVQRAFTAPGCRRLQQRLGQRRHQAVEPGPGCGPIWRRRRRSNRRSGRRWRSWQQVQSESGGRVVGTFDPVEQPLAGRRHLAHQRRQRLARQVGLRESSGTRPAPPSAPRRGRRRRRAATENA